MSVRMAMIAIVSLGCAQFDSAVRGEDGVITIADDPSSIPANTYFKHTRHAEFERVESPDRTKTFKTEMAIELLKPELFRNGVYSLAVLARHNASRIESVRSSLPEKFKMLLEVDDPDKVRIFLYFKPCKEQPADPSDGFRFYILPAVDYVRPNKGHLHSVAGSESISWEVWLYKDGKFILEQAASGWGTAIL